MGTLYTAYHDSATITLHERDLKKKKNGDRIETEKRGIPFSEGLEWTFDCCPAGWTLWNKGYLSVFVCIEEESVRASYTFSIDGTSVKQSGTKELGGWDGRLFAGFEKFHSHEELRPLFRKGKLTITCDVRFEEQKSHNVLRPFVFDSCDHIPTDLELVSQSNSVPVHKCFLSMVSPVFYAKFSGDTSEAKSDKLEIPDFDYDTVKAAIDFCYGREIMDKSIHTIVNILRFADKYDIKAVANLESIPSKNLSTETFCTIVQYAYDCAKNELLTQCCQFFKEHQKKLKTENNFAKLPPQLITRILKSSAFGLKTDFDVLRHACKNRITAVVEHLERSPLTPITINNFCGAAGYAWECSRDDLKNACIEFWNKNKVEITSLSAFLTLSQEIINGLQKLDEFDA